MARLVFALIIAMLACSPAAAQGCGPSNPNCIVTTAPNGTSNNQAASTAFVQNAFAGGSSLALSQNFLIVGNASNLGVGVPLSGDCTIVSSGAITCTKTNGTAFGALATLNVGMGLFSAGGNLNSAGPCTGTRAAKTANYTVVNGDKGSLFALSGGFFTLTLNAPSGYDSNFGICVTNENSVRMPFIAINGFSGPNGTAGFFICPGATEYIYNDNNVWKSSGPRRCLQAPTTFVTSGGTDWTTGTNDCLATGAGCGTPQRAYDLLTFYFDLQSGRANISIDAGSFTPTSGTTFISMLGALPGGARQGTQGAWLNISGAGQGSTTINMTNANGFACDQGCSAILSGMTITLNGGSGNQGNCAIADNGGQYTINNVTCSGITAGGNHGFQANGNAQINFNGPLTYSGTFSNGLFSVTGDSLISMDQQTITFSAATTAAALLDARSNSYIEFLSNTITNPGNLTAAAYNIPSRAFVDVTGTTLPGSAGIITDGGRIKGTAVGALLAQAPRMCEIISTGAATCNNGDAMANNGTLTTPTGATYLDTECVGGGGGGAGSGGTPGAATGGTNTTFGTLTANGGGAGSTSAGTVGAGGTATGGDWNITGGDGASGSNPTQALPGGSGGNNVFGGGGAPGPASQGAGVAAKANTGGGGGGAGSSAANPNSGGGGGAGGYTRKKFTSPAATFAYAIGPGGTGGTLGTNGAAGGNGAAGRCNVTAYFN